MDARKDAGQLSSVCSLWEAWTWANKPQEARLERVRALVPFAWEAWREKQSQNQTKRVHFYLEMKLFPALYVHAHMCARVIMISEWKQFTEAVCCFPSRKTYMHAYISIQILIFMHRKFPHIKVCSTYSLTQENAWVLLFIAQDSWTSVPRESEPPDISTKTSTLLGSRHNG